MKQGVHIEFLRVSNLPEELSTGQAGGQEYETRAYDAVRVVGGSLYASEGDEEYQVAWLKKFSNGYFWCDTEGRVYSDVLVSSKEIP